MIGTQKERCQECQLNDSKTYEIRNKWMKNCDEEFEPRKQC